MTDTTHGLRVLTGSSRSEMVIEAIEHAVLRGDLVPGTRLVEREIASVLGVSKTPVREALKILGQRGILTQHAYRGAEVRTIDRAAASHIYEVRLLLEPEAVRSAVTVARRDDFKPARHALNDAARAIGGQDIAELSLANRRFHRALYATTPNELLKAALDSLQDQVAMVSASAWRRDASWVVEAEEHEAILEAAVGGDSDLTASLVRQHIGRFVERLDAN